MTDTEGGFWRARLSCRVVKAFHFPPSVSSLFFTISLSNGEDNLLPFARSRAGADKTLRFLGHYSEAFQLDHGFAPPPPDSSIPPTSFFLPVTLET